MSNPILQEIALKLNIDEECVSLTSHPLSGLGLCDEELCIIDSILQIHKAVLDIEDICIHLKEYDIHFLECEIVMNKSRPDYIEFEGGLHFEKCQFGYIKIPNFVFKGNVTFYACIFLQDAFFNKTSFCHGVCFSSTQFCENVGFAETCFEGIANFSKIVFPKVANFGGCRFGKKESQCLVDFSNATFKEGTYFSRSHFLEIQTLKKQGF